jgi:hypothetical protein
MRSAPAWLEYGIIRSLESTLIAGSIAAHFLGIENPGTIRPSR